MKIRSLSPKKVLSVLLAFALIIGCFQASLLTARAGSVDVTADMLYKSYTHTDGSVMPYRLFLPTDYDSRKSYPVVVFLNGNGHQGTDNEAQLGNMIQTLFTKQVQMREAIVIAPQCSVGKRWVETDWTQGNYDDSYADKTELKKVVRIVNEVCSEYSANQNRIYAIGLSMGGIGTWSLLMTYSKVFAAGIPVCGAADLNKISILKNIPIWTFHGDADTTVPYAGTEAIVEAIEAAGGTKIKFTTYEGGNHFIWDTAASTYGLIDWLFSQKLSDRLPENGADYTAVNAAISAIPEDTSIYTNESIYNLKLAVNSVDWTLDCYSQEAVDLYAAVISDGVSALEVKAEAEISAEAAAQAVSDITYFSENNLELYDVYLTALAEHSSEGAEYKAEYDRLSNGISKLLSGYGFYDDGDNLGDYKTLSTTTESFTQPLQLNENVDASNSAYQVCSYNAATVAAKGLGALYNSGNSHLMWNWSDYSWVTLADKSAYEKVYGEGSGVQQIIPEGNVITDFQISYNPYYNLRIIYDYIDENNYSYIWFRGNIYFRLVANKVVDGVNMGEGSAMQVWNYNQTYAGLKGDAEGGPLDGGYYENDNAPARLLQAPRKTLRLTWNSQEECYYATFGNIENADDGLTEVTVKLNAATDGKACNPLTNIYIAHECQNVSLYRSSSTGLGATSSNSGVSWQSTVPTDTQIFDEVMVAYEDLDHICVGDVYYGGNGYHYQICNECNAYCNFSKCTEGSEGVYEGEHYVLCSGCKLPYGEKLSHTYNKQIVSKAALATAATCTTNAVYYYSCECGGVDKSNTWTAENSAKGHTYKTTTTKATLSTNGSKVTKCTVCGYKKSSSVIYKISSVKLAATTYSYTGKAISPAVTVKNSKGTKLVKGTDYTVSYASGRKNVGKYKVTVTFKGNYSGSKTLYFTVNPAKTTVKKLTPATKALKVSITKKSAQVSGYQIQYSTAKSFSGAKSVKITGTSKTIKSLKAKKTYYVRVRTYKKVGSKVYYSAWSSAKKAKTK